MGRGKGNRLLTGILWGAVSMGADACAPSPETKRLLSPASHHMIVDPRHESVRVDDELLVYRPLNSNGISFDLVQVRTLDEKLLREYSGVFVGGQPVHIIAIKTFEKGDEVTYFHFDNEYGVVNEDGTLSRLSDPPPQFEELERQGRLVIQTLFERLKVSEQYSPSGADQP